MPHAKHGKDMLVALIASCDDQWRVVATLACAVSASPFQLWAHLDDLWPGEFSRKELSSLLEQPIIERHAGGYYGVKRGFRQAVIRYFRANDPARYQQLNALLVTAEAGAVQYHEDQAWFARGRHALHLLVYDPETARPIIDQLLAGARNESHRAGLVRLLDESGHSDYAGT